MVGWKDFDLGDDAFLDFVWLKYKRLLWSLGCLAFDLGKSLLYYSFLLWIFLSIFELYGFEKTLVILLIGVFYVRIKRGYALGRFD
jgi:hypothetical protein